MAFLNGLELFGHERANIEVFKSLQRLGAAVIVGINARDHGGAVAGELSRQGLSSFLVPFGPQWSKAFVRKQPSVALTNLASIAKSSSAVFREARKFCPTHLYAGSPLVYSYLWPVMATLKCPLVYRMGDMPPDDSSFNMRIWRAAMKRSSIVVANSAFMRARAIDAGVPSHKVRIIHNVAPTRDESTEGGLRMHAPGNREGLLFVGAIAPHKGLVPLVEALALLRNEFPNLKLDALGESAWDGDFRAELTALIQKLGLEDRVVLRGHVADPAPNYRAAAVHVLPALWEEPTSNVVLEAKREGTPSLVFPAGGLGEVVRHMVDGFVCAEKSPAALAEGLRFMLGDAERLRAMGAAAREDYLTRFGRARFAEEWAGAFGDGPGGR